MYNSIGFIINFQFVLTEWQQEMKHFLSNKSTDTPLTRLVFGKNNFDTSSQEFSKDNFRYDVVKTELLGDSIVVYCFRDDKETRLTENFSEQLFENTSQKNFFENHPAYRSKAQYCGTPFLARKLNMVFLVLIIDFNASY